MIVLNKFYNQSDNKSVSTRNPTPDQYNLICRVTPLGLTRPADYIKAENLQDTTNKRNINADDKLKAVFGGKKTVSMFEMTSLVSKHLS